MTVSQDPDSVAFLFDLDGTMVDSFYQNVLAWRAALEEVGIDLSVWRIHLRIGMSGGLFTNMLLRDPVRRAYSHYWHERDKQRAAGLQVLLAVALGGGPTGRPSDDVVSFGAAGALVAGIWNHTNSMYSSARSFWRSYRCVTVDMGPKGTLCNACGVRWIHACKRKENAHVTESIRLWRSRQRA